MIPKTMIRITFGKREIYPTNEPLKWYWNDNDQVEVKMRILGGGFNYGADFIERKDYKLKYPNKWIKRNVHEYRIK